MKMRYVYAIGLAMLLGSCSERDIMNNPVPDGDVNSVTFSVKDFEWEGMTRTMAEKTSTGVTFKWTSTDTIGIFPNAGSQVAFPIEAGADAANAIFNGGGWALKENSTYKAYFPYHPYNFDQNKIKLDYSGQFQDGNDNMDHLSKRDYLASSLSTPESGKVNFDFEHVGCLMRFELTVPEEDSFYKMEFTNGSGLSKTMLLDIYSDKYTMTQGERYPNATMSIRLTNCRNTESNKKVVIYCMLPPQIYGVVARVILHGEKNSYANIKNYSKTFESGKAYVYQDELSVYTPDDPFNGYEYVDLGLESGNLWATCNIGASYPEEYGDYFAWGEIEPKQLYTYDTYKFYNGEYTKYNDVDGDRVLDLEDDAARNIMGGLWRIPSINDILELHNVAEGKWTVYNGVAGWYLEGINGSWMFIPAAGYYRGKDELIAENEMFLIWTNELFPTEGRAACSMGGTQIGWGGSQRLRSEGIPIRAVCKLPNNKD